MEPMLTLREVCEILRIGMRTFRRLAKEKRLPAFKVGGQWRVRREALEEYMAPHKEK